MGISSSAVLVELNVSVWGASKVDRDATDDVNVRNNATADASKVYKNLTAGTHLRKEVSDYAAKIRQFHNRQTLPWTHKGARLLPTAHVLEYKQHMNAMEHQFNALLHKFYIEYPNIVSQAQTNLRSMFKADDYPTLEEVKEKFGYKLVFSPLPEAGDFRLDVANEELRELSLSYEADFNERLGKAMREPWERLHETLTHLSTKLTDAQDGTDEVKRRYHDSLVTNAQSLCELLTKLNITNDPKLEEARRSLELTMLGVDIDSIKESPEVRHSVKSRVDAILEKFDW
jgi:hypothetical protein